MSKFGFEQNYIQAAGVNADTVTASTLDVTAGVTIDGNLTLNGDLTGPFNQVPTAAGIAVVGRLTYTNIEDAARSR